MMTKTTKMIFNRNRCKIHFSLKKKIMSGETCDDISLYEPQLYGWELKIILYFSDRNTLSRIKEVICHMCQTIAYMCNI